jgi:hypothetical protein
MRFLRRISMTAVSSREKWNLFGNASCLKYRNSPSAFPQRNAGASLF